MGLLITCTLVTTLYATTMTIANVSLPQIQGALSAGPDQVAWVVTANLIATAVTIPLAGWMSNRFGRRRVMAIGVAGFAVSTLLCGLSSSLEALIFWRVLQSGFCSPLAAVAQSVVIDEFPGEQRPRAVAIFMMGVGIAPTIAPLLGGYVCETLSWSWVFYIMLPIAILAFFGAPMFFEEHPRAAVDSSVHCKNNFPFDKKNSNLDVPIDDEVDDVKYINILTKTLDQIESHFTPDIVFYDAGVDVHSNDDLGNLNLTDDGIKKRDEIVCEYFKEKKIPLCTVIGGGYSKNRQELASRHFSIFETVSKTYL